MLIVGTIDSKAEADEIALITKFFVVGNKARLLAKQIRK